MDYSFFFTSVVVVIVAFVLCVGVMRYSELLKLIDVPNKRSMHAIKKSRGGGLAIFGAFSLGMFLSEVPVNAYIAIAFAIVFFLGLYDDRYGSSSKTKIFWIVIASIFLFFGDIYIGFLGVFLGQEVLLPKWIAFIFSLFALVGFINAVNLIDGLDGLSSGVGIVILAGFAYLGFKYNDMFLLYSASFLILALLTFLYFNWYPSKMFMGDSGSLTLGFVIAVLSIHSVEKVYITPVTILLLTAVPILDTLVVMLRRIRHGQNPFQPDKTHIHHIILKQHYNNVAKTTKILILLQVVFTYIGLGFKVRDDFVILTIFILLYVLFYSMLTPKRINKQNKH